MPRRLLPVLAMLLLHGGASAAQLTAFVSQTAAGLGNGPSSNAVFSPDVRCIAFDSRASNLVPGDTNARSDVFVLERQAGTISRVSLSASSAESNGDSYKPALSADCRYVAFSSYATNLVSGANDGISQIYLHDRATGQTSLLSRDLAGQSGNGDSYIPTLSADGRLIAYYSYASNLAPGDSNQAPDIFVHDRSSGETRLVSRGQGNAPANGESYMPVISADGRFVAYESWASNLVTDDDNGLLDIFLHDLNTGQTTLVSRGISGTPANGLSQLPALSADGRLIAYASEAGDLVANDGNGAADIFLHDRASGQTERISLNSAGEESNANSFSPALSADGRIVSFHSLATNLVDGDGNAMSDIFLRDRTAGKTLRLSVNASGNQSDDPSVDAALSGDGQSVLFISDASNLAPVPGNGAAQVMLAASLDPAWTPIPQAGWWWNPAEPGRGYFLETRGRNLYFAALLYEPDGRASWHLASGPMTDAATWQGALLAYCGGQTLTGAWQAPGPSLSPGTATLRFSDERHAALDWPGGLTPLERFPIAAENSAVPPAAPEPGWWWNPSEPGRGFTFEVTGANLYLSGLMYDTAGSPIWYVASGTLSDGAFQSTWLQYAGGQTLAGPYAPATLLPGTPGAVALQILGPRSVRLTLPDGRTIPLLRFAF